MKRTIFVDGDFIPSDSKTGRLIISSLLFGSGFFETVRLYSGFPFKLDKHIQRLNRAGKKIGIDFNLSPRMLEKIITELAKKNKLKNSRLRIWVGMDMDFFLEPEKEKCDYVLAVDTQPLDLPAKKFYQNGVKLRIHKIPRQTGSVLYGIKTTSYMENLYAKREAKLNGYFDALFINNDGFITESTTSNIFFVFGERVLTAPVEAGVLPGVTRDVVIEILKKNSIKFKEEAVKFDSLKNATEAFTTSSIVEIMPVIKIDDVKIGDGKPGKITKFLIREFRKYINSVIQNSKSRIKNFSSYD